ncbi:MAG: hypothetical protein WD152_00575, partial [Nitriliruptoraceae bacterium]
GVSPRGGLRRVGHCLRWMRPPTRQAWPNLVLASLFDRPKSRWCRFLASSSAGSSPLGAVISLAVLLSFLLLATQVLVHLYATSVVDAAAFDGARDASTERRSCSAAGPSGAASVEDAVRRRLGGLGDDPTLVIACQRRSDVTVVSITVASPARLLRGGPWLAGVPIDRTATVRTEQVR